MKHFNFNLLKNLLEIPSQSYDCELMQGYLWAYAEAKGWTITNDDVGNLYVTKGESDTYPCVVAHMDTVHRILPGGIKAVMVTKDIITGINPLTMRQTGIGGDDKCGIFSALEVLNTLPYGKVAFFVDEEVGCNGSLQADTTFFRDCRFVLQSDRRGNTDFITDIGGDLSSRKFQKDVFPLIEAHGFKFDYGMMTDVEALRDIGIGISVANMSSGYYNPHQDNEYISIRDVENTLNLMLAICTNMTDVYEYTPPPKPKHVNTWSSKYNILDAFPEDEESVDAGFSQDRVDAISMEEYYQQKYGVFDDDDAADIDHMAYRGKSIQEMTEAEWIAYQNDVVAEDIENDVDDVDDVDRLCKLRELYRESYNTPYETVNAL